MNKKPLFVIFMTVFIDLVGFGIIIPLSPYLAREFGADAFDIGLLMAVYSAMQFLFAPIWGQLSDKWGRRPIILISLLGAAFSHLLFGFAETFTVLVVARLFAGICGANISTAMAYIADVTSDEDRSKGMGMIGAAFGLGFIFGPFLGGVFGRVGMVFGDTPPLGQSFAAVVASLICLGNFFMAFFYLKESLPELLQKMSRKRGSRLKRIVTSVSLPTVGPLMIMFFLTTLAMAYMEATLFLFVQDEFGWGLMKASFGFAYVGVVMVITQGYLIRKFMPKFGERRVMIAGLVLAALGLAGIGLAYDVALMALVVTLLGLGIGMSNPAITGSISLLSKDTEQGERLGTNQSLSALARIVGPPLGGWFYQHVGHSVPFFISGGFAALALVLGLMVFYRLPEPAREVSDG